MRYTFQKRKFDEMYMVKASVQILHILIFNLGITGRSIPALEKVPKCSLGEPFLRVACITERRIAASFTEPFSFVFHILCK